MAIFLCDVEMTAGVDERGESRWCDPEDLERLKKGVYDQFYKTPVGIEFKNNYLAASMDRVEREFALRYGATGQIGKKWPGVILCGRLEEVVGDLMRVKDPGLISAWESPEPLALPAPLTEEQEHRALVMQIRKDMEDLTVPAKVIAQNRKGSVKYEKAWRDANDGNFGVQRQVAPQAPSEAVQFAHMVNAAVRDFGIGSLKPNAGVTTLRVGDKKYDYNSADFENLYKQAAEHNLLK